MKKKTKRHMNFAPATPVVRRGMFAKPFAASFCADLIGGGLTLKWDTEDWCAVYRGRKKIWDCNGTFARCHFFEGSRP